MDSFSKRVKKIIQVYDKITNLTLTSNKFPDNVSNVKNLNCNEQVIFKLPITLNKLEQLDCTRTFIREIPLFVGLSFINCSWSSVSEIKNYPSLKTLICHDTNILSVPEINSLEYLDCSFSNVRKIKSVNLTYLDCNYCLNLNKINPMDRLRYLNCSNTYITELPKLNLKVLICYNTNITKLYDMDELETLDCSGTYIKELPYLPKLFNLTCDNTKIKSISVGSNNFNEVSICDTRIKIIQENICIDTLVYSNNIEILGNVKRKVLYHL